MEEGKLYLVSTPIGNLEDITLRALRVLGEANVILSEDTRTTKKLLSHYKIPTPQLISFFEGNEERRIPEILDLLRKGKNVVVVSESGTPLISDPGYKLVREVIAQDIKVESVPGPTALVTALTSSGLPTNAFLFLGYLPKKGGKTKKLLGSVKNCSDSLDLVKTAVLYESPHRLIRTLHLIEEVFGNAKVVIARELTKVHEEIRRENVAESIVHFNEVRPRGEFVILLSLE